MAASNLTTRLLTAVVAIPLLLALLFLGPAWGWFLFILVAAAVGAYELFGMTHPGDALARGGGIVLTLAMVAAVWFSQTHPKVLLTAFVLVPSISIWLTLWRLGDIPTAALRVAASTFGPLWVGGGLGAIALLRAAGEPDGAALVVFSLGLAWLGDTGGYFAGRAFGKHKLYEKVSPKKTVEGAVGGVTTTIALAVVGHYLILPSLPIRDAVILGALGSILGIFGDLGESLLKRSVGVKDSGGIVPGHGGILDRIDAVLITAPLTLLYVLWMRV
ncbi:MAG: phosphatidate cytidylyltransferase [Polyangiaceae bacterium]